MHILEDDSDEASKGGGAYPEVSQAPSLERISDKYGTTLSCDVVNPVDRDLLLIGLLEVGDLHNGSKDEDGAWPEHQVVLLLVEAEDHTLHKVKQTVSNDSMEDDSKPESKLGSQQDLV